MSFIEFCRERKDGVLAMRWGFELTLYVALRLQAAAGGLEDGLCGGGRFANTDSALDRAAGCRQQLVGEPAPRLLARHARGCAERTSALE